MVVCIVTNGVKVQNHKMFRLGLGVCFVNLAGFFVVGV